MSEVDLDSLDVNRNDESFNDVSVVKNEWDGRQIDWLLQWFVKFINQTSTKVGVTLTVGGSQITGNLISHEIYFSRLADSYSEAFRKFEGVDVDQVKEMILGFNVPAEVTDEKPAPPFQYLHLEDVTVMSGDRPVVYSNGLWRGKISSVEGFILGR